MAWSVVLQGARTRAKESPARFDNGSRMLREFDDLALGDSANKIQVQPPLAFFFFRVYSGAHERVDNQQNGGETSANDGEQQFPIGKQLFQRATPWM